MLYKMTTVSINLRCVTKEEARKIMKVVHGGECGSDMNRRMLAKKVERMGYYWPTIEAVCHAYVKGCYKCQIYANLQH